MGLFEEPPGTEIVRSFQTPDPGGRSASAR
jgi:hypothetical protein